MAITYNDVVAESNFAVTMDLVFPLPIIDINNGGKRTVSIEQFVSPEGKTGFKCSCKFGAVSPAYSNCYRSVIFYNDIVAGDIRPIIVELLQSCGNY